MLNADMFFDSTRTFWWFGGDRILWEVLVKDCIPIFSLYLCRIPKIHKHCSSRHRLLIQAVLGQHPVLSFIWDIPFAGYERSSSIRVGVVLCIESADRHRWKILLPVPTMPLKWGSLSISRSIDILIPFFCAWRCIRLRKLLRLLSILGLVWGSLLCKLWFLCIAEAVWHEKHCEFSMFKAIPIGMWLVRWLLLS